MHSTLFDTSMDISRYGQGHITYTGTINDDPCLQTQFSECSSLVLNIYLHACVKKKCMPYTQLFWGEIFKQLLSQDCLHSKISFIHFYH